MQGRKVHLTRASPARYVPPSGFDYPLGGFLPFDPGRFCFAPAALMGFTLRSFLLSGGQSNRFRSDEPTYRWPGAYTHPKMHTGRRRRFLGFDPFASPWRIETLLAPRSLDAPLGFPLPGSAGPSLVRDFARTPPSCLAGATALRRNPTRTMECPSARAWLGDHLPRTTGRNPGFGMKRSDERPS
jgi:hypothetical protein